LQAAPALVPAGFLGAPQPAAASVSTKVCNSSDSTDLHRIRVWVYLNPSVYYYVNHGSCGPWLANGDDQLRVNTCPDGNTFSYYVIKTNSGYGPKHYGCNSDSNVPDYNGNAYYKMMN